MIRNFVFDVGNVLARWDPVIMSHRLFPKDPEMAQFVLEKGFRNPLWFKGDEGITTMKEIAKEMSRGEDQAHQDAMLYAMTHFQEVLIPMEGTLSLLRELKQRGYRCYLLSNYCEYFVESIKTLGALPYVDGYVYSHQEKAIKPNLEIYRILLKRYGLKGEECVFIDDKPGNVQAALDAGFGYGFIYKFDDDALRAYIKESL